MKRSDNLGMMLLAVWLLVTGAAGLFKFSFDGMSVLLAALAIAAGVLLLAGK